MKHGYILTNLTSTGSPLIGYRLVKVVKSNIWPARSTFLEYTRIIIYCLYHRKIINKKYYCTLLSRFDVENKVIQPM